ncbi:hypothetical protein ASF57_19955 [Methylobacterium sp. Leaf117]|nr:hypothetical protein ASF57_19955 [Methylobacterium sp. Leaf117]
MADGDITVTMIATMAVTSGDAIADGGTAGMAGIITVAGMSAAAGTSAGTTIVGMAVTSTKSSDSSSRRLRPVETGTASFGDPLEDGVGL